MPDGAHCQSRLRGKSPDGDCYLVHVRFVVPAGQDHVQVECPASRVLVERELPYVYYRGVPHCG